MFGITKKNDENYFDNTPVLELKPQDFDSSETYKLKSKECTLVMFYAPWCGFCKNTKDVWIKLAYHVGFAEIAAFNCQKQEVHLMKMNSDHSSGEFIKGYPTIIMYKGGSPYKIFSGERNYENLLKFSMECKNAKY